MTYPENSNTDYGAYHFVTKINKQKGKQAY